jgi:transcriptional regulator with XRE-family HTH domain
MKNKVNRFRTRFPMTLRELSKASGVPLSTVARIDKDISAKISLAQGLAIAKALKIKPADLLPH